MKDLPLSTLLPIMLETAEMSSDAEELAEEVGLEQEASLNLTRSNPPRRQSTSNTSANISGTVPVEPRRSSLPFDRSSSVIRRQLNQLRLRRKTSAPPAAPLSASPTNPLACMTGSPLIDLLEKLRPRQSSTADSGVGSIPGSVSARVAGARRRSLDVTHLSTDGSRSSRNDEGFHSSSGEDPFWRPLFVDTRLANTTVQQGEPATVPRRCLYNRQTSLAVAAMDESGRQWQRQRSNSETGRYLLMRRCGDAIGISEFVGKLEVEWAYCQILATMKCLDLMPPLAKMVVVDSTLTVRKAFHALVHNGIRAAPIWDGQLGFAGLLTITDLIYMLMESTDLPLDWSEREQEEQQLLTKERHKSVDEMLSSELHYWVTSRSSRGIRKHSDIDGNDNTTQHHFNRLVSVCAENSVANAAKLLCDRRLHRVVVLDNEIGRNALFLISKKDILKALRIYIAKLPLPGCMERTLDDLNIGTWNDLVMVTPQTTLYIALSLFISKDLSSLPVVNDQFHILDMLTKVDVLNLVIGYSGPIDGILGLTVRDATRNRAKGAETMTTCSKKATLLLAVERLLHSDAHRLAIVDSDGKLEGILAMADLMKFLTCGFP